MRIAFSFSAVRVQAVNLLSHHAVQQKHFFFCLKKLLSFGAQDDSYTTKRRANMKKLAIIAAIAALSSAPVFAAHPGGFNGPNAAHAPAHQAQGGFADKNAVVTTVAKAKEMKDDSWVKLRGNITERVSDDRYVFRDASGTVNVEIDDKHWNGQTYTPQDQVEIQGKVDKEWNDFEIEVKQIAKVTP